MKKFMNLEKALIVKIEQDDYSESPRSWDNLGTFYTWQNRYQSPDDNEYKEALDFFSAKLGEEIVEKVHAKYDNTVDFMEDIQKRFDKAGYLLYPVSMYDHSGTSYFIGCASDWDTGTVGVIFVEKEKIYQEFNCKRLTKDLREKVCSIFEDELETYTSWSNGYVYQISISDLAEQIIESCGGFYFDKCAKEEFFNYAHDLYDIGTLSDFEEYDAEKLHDTYEIKTATTITRKK